MYLMVDTRYKQATESFELNDNDTIHVGSIVGLYTVLKNGESTVASFLHPISRVVNCVKDRQPTEVGT